MKRRLASLQERGAIKRVGPDKGGHWEVQKDFELRWRSFHDYMPDIQKKAVYL